VLFLQVIGKEVVTSKEYSEPLSLHLPDGRYLLEAWLTTDSANRQFASAATLWVHSGQNWREMTHLVEKEWRGRRDSNSGQQLRSPRRARPSIHGSRPRDQTQPAWHWGRPTSTSVRPPISVGSATPPRRRVNLRSVAYLPLSNPESSATGKLRLTICV
jgi:hypothetical protein